MRWLLLAAITAGGLSVMIAGCRSDRGLPATHGIHNFGKVDDRLYRGAQPDAAGLTNLAQLGVKTIISLRTPGDAWAPEADEARGLGILFTNVPLKGLGRPADDQIAKILSIIESSPGPVFVHCEYGCDRTGTVIASYRIRYDHWSAVKAQEEADHFGMSRLERGMKDFIADFGKLPAPPAPSINQ